ncbi:endoplasmic reticulum lectin 1 isoform X2 [Nomia melanderi]|uniref:endoplasmic reticulum lectin 1 isoform X2 n=1 Tax=Nomia melanderi TaxID=2448451 RepID=UPI001303FD9F|nr:endoplasmic reticulum lectin 1 isoform X2 [Nomia melanderi]
MWKYCGIYYVLLIIIAIVYGHDLKSFDDTVLFKINWPGKPNPELAEPYTNVESYFITTANNEQYECLIPDNTDQEPAHNEPYYGANPMEILSLLFKNNICSYKVDSYWTYELCHGRFVRQYHQDRDGKKEKIQEYTLGTFNKLQEIKLLAKYDERDLKPNRKAEIPVIKVDGINMPYVEVEMGDGTVCDISNKPRKIKVQYVCYTHVRHDLFSVEEPKSCEYEAIVLTHLLCHHPDYKPHGIGGNEINCLPVDNAPKKPRALIAMEKESKILRHQKATDGKTRVRVEIHPVDVMDKNSNADDSISSITGQGISPAEVSPVKNFLSGKNCLHGGNGWWKYEFCYGRSVVQYHIERDGTKTIVNLGKFDKQKHLDWIASHPHKKPKPPELRKQLSHFYSDGTICDKTGNPRQTEVKLKCVKDHAASPSSVSLFLLEPRTCEYVLGVESPLICDILEYADENGLLSEKFEVNFDKLKTTVFHEYDDLDLRIANGDD